MSRRKRRGSAHKTRKWIKRAVKRPGALRRKMTRWYGLKPDQKISASMYSKAYKRAKRTGDPRTMRQVNLAKTLSRLRRKKKKRARVTRFRVGTRRRAANPHRRAANPHRRRSRVYKMRCKTVCRVRAPKHRRGKRGKSGRKKRR